MTYIPSNFFHYSNIEKIIIGYFDETENTIISSIVSIESAAFRGCGNLETVIFPKSLKNIGNSAFHFCSSLTTLPLYEDELCPALTTIGDSAFYECKKLGMNESDCTNFINLLYTYNDDGTIEKKSNITTIGASAFYDAYYLNGEYTDEIMESLDYDINSTAFLGTSIIKAKEFLIESNTTKIDKSAFSGVTNFIDSQGNLITEIIIPEGITEIGESAFSSCTSIESLILPSSLTTIGEKAFYGCKELKNITATNGCENLTTIEKDTFNGCKNLTTMNFEYLTTLKDRCFFLCSKLTEFNFEGIKYIGIEAFTATSLISVKLPSCLETIEHTAFRVCSYLKEFDCSATSLKTIPQDLLLGAGAYTTLKITLNEDLVHIQSGAFARTTIETIDIPESVEEIQKCVFYNCTSLKKVTGCEGVKNLGVTYIEGREYLYHQSDTTFTEKNVFTGCTNLEKVEGLTKVTNIAEYLFKGCTSLNELSLVWQSLTNIGTSAFLNCSSLTGNITIPSASNCTVTGDPFVGSGLIVSRAQD